MKKLLCLLAILIIGFTSCEGRKTQRQALSEDIEAFKKEVEVEKIVYEPEAYMQREVDTLLYNGYRVKIKTYSDMDNAVLFTKIKDTINYQTYYRNFGFDILIEKNGKRIFNQYFNKEKVNSLFKFDTIKDYNFVELGVLKSIEINDDLSFSDRIKIEVMYAIPETDKTSLHSLSIDNKGTLKVEHIETN